eukprot:Rmarinus@m.12425
MQIAADGLPILHLSLYDLENCPTDQVSEYTRFNRASVCKLFLSEVLPNDVDRVMVLDADIVVARPYTECWDHFETFDNYTFLSLGPDQGGECQVGSKGVCYPRLYRLFNGGVSLMHLTRMRENGFSEAIVRTARAAYESVDGIPSRFGDQCFLNAFLALTENANRFKPLPCQCNYQYGSSMILEVCPLSPYPTVNEMTDWYGSRSPAHFAALGNRPVLLHGYQRRYLNSYPRLAFGRLYVYFLRLPWESVLRANAAVSFAHEQLAGSLSTCVDSFV